MLQVSPEIRNRIEESCTKLSLESGKALKALASDFKTMTKSPSAEPHVANAKAAAKSLKSLLKSGLWEDIDLLEVVPAATVGSLLLDVVNCTEKIVESVYELGSVANFQTVEATLSPEKSHELGKICSDKQNLKMDCPHVVIKITESPPVLPENIGKIGQQVLEV